MKMYVWVSFAFMGWAYYEMSGGTDFERETRAGAEQDSAELVARANTTTLLSLSTSDAPGAEDAPTADAILASFEGEPAAPSPALEQAVAEIATGAPLGEISDDDVTEVITEFVSLSEPQPFYGTATEASSENAVDLRQVAGSRVNMRQGPGTDYGVIVTLDSGTQVEVLEVDGNGWARLRTVSTGQEGWMAERLLTN